MISDITFVFFLFVSFTLAFEIVQPNLQNTEVILCRSCGHAISSNRYIFSKPSPKAHDYFNDTLFNKDEVLVEVFLAEYFFSYPVIVFYRSECVGVGEWDENTSWYPGYRWRPCLCPECGAYIGWVFEPIIPYLVEPSKTFYGLILNSLISKNSVDSLTKYPNNLSN